MYECYDYVTNLTLDSLVSFFVSSKYPRMTPAKYEPKCDVGKVCNLNIRFTLRIIDCVTRLHKCVTVSRTYSECNDAPMFEIAVVRISCKYA